ncbi:hypothetical protein F5882DRAFT_300193, partial [Hyaloscypha sp. PMI_1271]
AIVSVLAIVYTIVTLSTKFRHLTLKLYRTTIYASLSLSTIVFIIHGLIIYG